MAYSQTLKKINTEAKRIHAKSPGISYKTAVMQASANYRAGKLGTVGKVKKSSRKKAVRRKAPRKRSVTVKRSVSVKRVAVGSVDVHLAAARHLLLHKLAKETASLMTAKTKMHRRKIQKQIAETKKRYRKLLK